MNRTSLLSLGISLFCSCVMSNAVYDAAGPLLAGPASSQAVQRGLEDIVASMGAGEVGVPSPVSSVIGIPVQPPSTAEPLGPVVEWILAKGKDTKIDGSVAKELGLGNGAEIWTKQKIFKDDKGRYSISITTASGRVAIIFVNRFATVDQDAEVFLTSQTGMIEKSLAGKNGTISHVPHEQLARSFEATKKMWIDVVPAPPPAVAQLRVGL